MTLITTAVAAAVGQQPTGAVGTVVGQVLIVESRAPLQGAQVTVLGTTLRASANAEGRYVIRNVPAGSQTVRVQMLGFAPNEHAVTVAAGGTATLNFEMKDIPYAIAPVVTTALGIAREEKSLGYATTTISAATLEKIPETTMMQALAGQSAGVAMTSGSGRPGAGARVVIRGESSFSGNGQPLFVIDGVPVSVNSSSPSNALATGSAGSRQMDLDMENVDEITVLKGAAATALYGSRAANGAIIIKTKTGKPGQPLRFNFSTELRYDTPILGGYVTDWAAGSRGYFCNGKNVLQGGWCEPGSPSAANPQSLTNWGPHKDSIPQVVFDSLGSVRFRDPRADFYKSSPTSDNSLRGSGAMGDLGTYTLGGSYLNQTGVNPAEKLGRLNLNANISIHLSKWLQSSTSLQKVRSSNPYSDDSFSGIDKTLIDLPATFDVRRGYMPDGTPVFLTGGTNGIPSLQWQIANQFNTELTNRWIGSQQFSLTVGPGIHLNNNAGLDTYVSEFGRFLNQRPWLAAIGTTSGSTQQRKSTQTTINDDMTLIVDSRPLMNTNVRVSGLLGGNIYSQENAALTGNGTSIVIPNYYSLGNFATQTVNATLTTQRRLLGGYGQLEFDYSDWGFLTFTGRNDWSSTLPTDANSYFYPSVQLAVIFTDALKWRPHWLDYGKIRVSSAKVGNDAPLYALTTRYNNAGAPGANNSQQQFGGPAVTFPFRGVTSYISSQSLGNPILKPETTVENEIGLEMRMFGGRAQGEVSVYRKSSYDQIFSVPSSASTGFTNISRNAGNLRNNGIEVSVGGRPIDTRRFSWDARVNWAKNRSQVLSLAPGVSSIFLSGYSWPQIRIMEGQPYGVIWGYGWKKNCVAADPCFKDVAAGTMLIGDDGFPIKSDDQRNLGSVQPDWTGSATSEFRFGPVAVSGLVDIRHGGKLINFETQYEVTNGRSLLTEDRYTWTTWPGVNINTGQPNAKALYKDQDYYPLIYGTDRSEQQIENAGFAKLREVTLSYSLSENISRRLNLQNAVVYVTGRNLRGWYSSPSGDPEQDLSQGTNAGQQYFRQFAEPQSRSFLVGIRSLF
ncbi:MAG: SusC/RagA family TonB-linked outer membrane protein [bacterium]